jgi:O-antigen ligase
MRNLTRYLLWIFVFTVPWDHLALPFVGSLSRAFGLAVVPVAVLSATVQGRIRKPDAVFGFAIAFSVWGALTLLWTISYEDTLVLAVTTAQLVCSVWVIREFVRTSDEMETLLAAICFGLFVPLIDLLNNFRIDSRAGIGYESRYTGSGLNADQVGLYLVLGLPIAWHLLMHRRGIVRVVAAIYVVTAPLGLILTATRGAFVACFVALLIIPLTLRKSVRSYALAGAILIAAAISAVLVAPSANWARIEGTGTELVEGGSMSGRTDIWDASLRAFPQRPLLGAGLGAHGVAIEPFTHKRMPAHNTALEVLVEDGIVGLCLFIGLIVACGWTIVRLQPSHRVLWGVISLTWLVASVSGSTLTVKFTWVLFGLIAAQSGLRRPASDVVRVEPASRAAGRSLRTAAI